MAKRKHVSDALQAEVLVKSRRRCCVCFGLNNDATLKHGQIAHLDKNAANDSESNLAFLCLVHHDQFDSRTSQSKNFTRTEIERYRVELYQHFSSWNRFTQPKFLLNYIAASIGTKDIAKTLLKVGHEVTLFPVFQIQIALVENEVELIDGDLAFPLLHILDNLASWGWLTYEFDEPDEQDNHFRFRISQTDPDAAKDLMNTVLELER
jgi:hypothetical protein